MFSINFRPTDFKGVLQQHVGINNFKVELHLVALRYCRRNISNRTEVFSWNGPRKQGFLVAIENSRREIGMLMFQRCTVIARSLASSRISFNKPRPRRLVAEKTHRRNSSLANRKQPELP